MKSKKTSILIAAAIAFALTACNNSPENSDEHNKSEEMHEHEGNETHEHHHDADSVHTHDMDSSHHEMSEVIYQCPMHPEVTSDKPGTCSKCGMELEKKTK